MHGAAWSCMEQAIWGAGHAVQEGGVLFMCKPCSSCTACHLQYHVQAMPILAIASCCSAGMLVGAAPGLAEGAP